MIAKDINIKCVDKLLYKIIDKEIAIKTYRCQKKSSMFTKIISVLKYYLF